MNAVLLTWRWQNILTIWVMIIGLYLAVTVGRQIMLKREGNQAASDA